MDGWRQKEKWIIFKLKLSIHTQVINISSELLVNLGH